MIGCYWLFAAIYVKILRQGSGRNEAIVDPGKSEVSFCIDWHSCMEPLKAIVSQMIMNNHP